MWSLVNLVYTLVGAVGQYREMRRRGERIQWGKTLAVMAGVILITLVGLAVLFVGLSYDSPGLGVGGFFAVFVLGLAAMVIASGGGSRSPAVRRGLATLFGTVLLIGGVTGLVILCIELGLSDNMTTGIMMVIVVGGTLLLIRLLGRAGPVG